MTAKPEGSRARHEPTTNLADPDEFRAFMRCPKCNMGCYDKQDALGSYLSFFCPICGEFLDMNSFSLEFLHCVDTFWKGGEL